jgi:hypothetical protein
MEKEKGTAKAMDLATVALHFAKLPEKDAVERDSQQAAAGRARAKNLEIKSGNNILDASIVNNGLPFSLWEKGWDEGVGRLLTFGSFARDEFASREFISRTWCKLAST